MSECQPAKNFTSSLTHCLKARGDSKLRRSRISQKATIAFLALVIVQAAHSIEEYVFRLYKVFAPARFVSGLISTDLRIGFIAFNVAFITFGFWCYAVPVRKALPAAIPLMWFWVVVEILNGTGHPVISIIERAYIPGTATCRWRIPEIMPQWVSGRGRDSGAAICTKKNPMASVPLRHLASVLPSLNAPVDD
jgi:hypothetical protein